MSCLKQATANVPLSYYTTYKVGGPARWLIEIETLSEMQTSIQQLEKAEEPYFILGRGSNVLFDDRGFEGTVIVNKMTGTKWQAASVWAAGGVNFAYLGMQSARKGFSGLEFAAGIPASVGGAIYMNAGAKGQEVKDVVESIDYINDQGVLQTLGASEVNFAYRTSSFQGKKGCIVGATFRLHPCVEALVRQKQWLQERIDSQPYKAKSCGCIFRNPQGDSAGRLIEACGLKGKAIGDAKVSMHHANFIINQGNATCEQIIQLLCLVQQEVKRQTGILLEREVRLIPYRIKRLSDE